MTSPVPSDETFDKYPIIQRQQFAQHLTSFLNAQSDIGYVLNLNAEWGTGKTTFLQCWYNDLKADHPVIYFDAWKHDFTHDAMTALLDCFHAQLANTITENKELLENFFNKGSHFIKKAIPSIIVGYLKHKTGTEDESWISSINEAFGIDVAEKEAGDAIKEVLSSVLEQRNKVQGIDEFKKALSKIAEAYIDVKNGDIQYPVYVFIDELDRCRPTYAIEVIESVKHFFNIPNFVFVIATDSKQLQHSIKAVYGTGFDSHLYLSRFFDQSVRLPKPELELFIKNKLKKLNGQIKDVYIPLIEDIFHYHEIKSIREINKILSVLDIAASQNKTFRYIPLLTLNLLNLHYPALYAEFITKHKNPYAGPYDGGGLTNEIAYNTRNCRPLVNNGNTSIPFEQVLQISITGAVDKKSTDKYFVDDVRAFSSQNQHSKIVHAHNNEIPTVINSAALRDYINIIELAGHFEM